MAFSLATTRPHPYPRQFDPLEQRGGSIKFATRSVPYIGLLHMKPQKMNCTMNQVEGA